MMEEFRDIPLPGDVLSIIASLLSHKDLLHFRLTCKAFHDAALCKAVLQKWKVRARFFNSRFSSFGRKIFGGRFIRLVASTKSMRDDHLKDLLQHMPNLEDLVINTHQLHCLQEGAHQSFNCLSLADQESEYLKMLDITEYQSYCDLFHGIEIKKLCLYGNGGNYFASLIRFMLESTRSIVAIKFVSIYPVHAFDDGFSDFLSLCHHIKEWEFYHVRIDRDFAHMWQLPDNVISLKCVDSDLLLNKRYINLEDLLYVNCRDYNPSDLTDFWRHNTLTHLKSLVLKQCQLESKLEYCFNMQYLEMNASPYPTLMALSNAVKYNLQVLVIGFIDIDNERLVKLVEDFTGLKKLVLYGLDSLTLEFLYSLKNKNLKSILIRNCLRFLDKRVKQELALRRDSFSFEVRLDVYDVRSRRYELAVMP